MRKEILMRFSFWEEGLKIIGEFCLFFGILILLIFSFVFQFPEEISATHHTKNDNKVFISDAESQKIKENYNSSIEKGFCLFGYKKYGNFHITKVMEAKTGKQTASEVEFTCIPEMTSQGFRLFGVRKYKYLGIVHTHPNYPYLSRPDSTILGLNFPFERLSGIYNGRKLNFFKTSSLSYPLVKGEMKMSWTREKGISELNIFKPST